MGALFDRGVFHPPGRPSAQPNTALRSRSTFEACGGPERSGGKIEALKLAFADSTQIFSDRPVRLQETKWFFENFSVRQLSEFVCTCRLSPEQLNDLARTSRVEVATNGCLVSPSQFIVRSLRPDSRARIYSVLENSPFNYGQQYPFRFAPKEFESRFECSRLSREKLLRIRDLTYTNRGDLCLADLQELPQILSQPEFESAVDALYRFPVYLLRLRVSEESDVKALVKYWGRGGRERRIQPLISSLAKVGKIDESSINLGLLLPDFARLRLYTYPNSWNDPAVNREDCFWSSMNFFNDQPDPGFFQPEYTKRVLQSRYHSIEGEAKLGDLITLVDGNGNGLHMCVHLVDHFVFTKNGANVLSPWVIMKTSDMLLLFFPNKDERKIVIYRRNDLD